MSYTLPTGALEAWLERLAKAYELFVPVDKGGFGPYQGKKPYLRGRTKLSVKEFFLPARETILTFEARPSAIPKPVSGEERPRVVFGVRPCDAKGLSLIAKVFKDDKFFAQRLEKTLLIGLMCEEPERECFGWAMGLDPFAGEGLDVLLFRHKDHYLVKALNKRGEGLVALAETRAASAEDEKALETLRAEFHRRYSLSPMLEKLRAGDLMRMYEGAFWEDLAFACLNCGTCTFLCPTCYCFDIQDEVVGALGVRVRLPDSCMFELYSRHASGHNPRRSPVARFRNRFMHKFKYYLDRYGEVLCVGCGRCVEACPADVNLWDVLQAMSAV